MPERETLFQEKLEQLEAGEPLEACLVGLGEEDAAAFRLIATMRAAAFPAQDPISVQVYREQLLHKTVQEKPMRPSTPTNPAAPTWGAKIKQWQEQLDWVFTRRLLAGGVVALFIGACLLVSSLVAIRLASSGRAPQIAGIGGDNGTGKPPTSVITPADTPGSQNSSPQETPRLPNEVFVPIMPNPLVANPQTAIIQEVRGRVEIQTSDGLWAPVWQTGQISAGQRIRTGDLSQAALTYFDGSQAILGPNSELALDELNAQLPQNGFRTVVMTQLSGTSEHQVAFRNDGGSRYEVKTAAGNGIARGTRFQVAVTPDLRTRFTVSEGRVDVSNLSRTVSVGPGQQTQAMAGRIPDPPAFRISGEGQVGQMGATWIIAGQSFQTHSYTQIIGDPQMGDLVQVEGHLTADGVRLADQIVLLQSSLNNQFALMGTVSEISPTSWTVAGQPIVVNGETQIEPGISEGDLVRVEGRVLAGNILLAEQIFRLNGPNGFPFQFTGVVQQMGANSWLISGQTVAVTGQTQIGTGIAVGDVVVVRGRILADGSWSADSIQKLSQPISEFTLTGPVQSLNPWNVAGTTFETRDWTVIEPGIAVGDLVRVRGIILNDGTWVAVSITSLQNPPLNVIIIIGIVTGINPWSLNGIPLIILPGTIIGPGITVGQLIIVQIQIQPNGSWVVLSIQPLQPVFGLGCLTITTIIISITGNQLNLQHWGAITLDDDLEIQGNLQPNSIIFLPICTLPTGTIIIVNVIVIVQPIIIVLPGPGPGPGNGNHNSNDND